MTPDDAHIHLGVPRGDLVVITGTMFGGKTRTMIDYVYDARSRGLDMALVKHTSDTRYETSHGGRNTLSCHDGFNAPAQLTTDDPRQIDMMLDFYDGAGIDEIQFYDHELVEIIQGWREKGKYIIVAGLRYDLNGDPFQTTAELLKEASVAQFRAAPCDICKRPGFMNVLKRPLEPGEPLVGGSDLWGVVCAQHMDPSIREKIYGPE